MSHAAAYAISRNVMNPWFGRVEFRVGLIAPIVIRVPFGRRYAELKVVESQKGRLLSGLWLFRRSHVDLGDNWSISLELHTQHKVVDQGVYKRLRHPMYTSIFLQAIAQALLLPNRVAGPACLLAFILMFALRAGAEERMMLKRFGDDYALYIEPSKRLVPGVW